jgi:malate dehydrogenase
MSEGGDSIPRVLITGAAGQIAYSLIFMVANGLALGADRKLHLHLLDIPPMAAKVDAVKMELDDIAPGLVESVLATTNDEEAFTGVDIALLVGARPRGPGMERKDLLGANAGIFKRQGQLLNTVASKDVKVVVVGNPANTNAYIAAHYAPSIPRENFTALTRLDMNRASSMLANRAGVHVRTVSGVLIWGNHSATQVPDARFAATTAAVEEAASHGDARMLPALINDQEWLHGEFVSAVQQRGKAVIAARGASSAASAAKAICDHTRDWVMGTGGRMVCMGVVSKGEYGVDEGIVYSMPLTCTDGRYSVIDDLAVDEWTRGKMDASLEELRSEAVAAMAAVEGAK